MNLDENDLNKVKKLNFIHTTWRDYYLMLLNSTSDKYGLRSNWRDKTITSIIHSSFNFNIISEGNLIGLEILSELERICHNFTKPLIDDVININSWENYKRISGSKKMQVKLYFYPQEPISSMAHTCLTYIVNNWDENKWILKQSQLLSEMWDLSQLTRGDCLYPDEVLTYSLDKNLQNLENYKNNMNKNYENFGSWINASYDVFYNDIPDGDNNRFLKYWTSRKKKENELFKIKTIDEVKSNNIRQLRYFQNVINIILKEDILGCPSWKRLCICVLKNDVSFRYAGFAMTYKERIAREEALEALQKLKNKNKQNKDLY